MTEATAEQARFAILVYNPKEEFKLRAGVQRLSRDLEGHGWLVVTLDLQRRMAKLDRSRGLGYAKSKPTPLNVPVVLLYPGERRGQTALSFMGMLEPDRDYRPRIYG